MSIVLLTNNPLAAEKLKLKITIIFEDKMDYMGILKDARNRIHKGAALLTHPLSGSIKPGETPFKSVLLEAAGKSLDTPSLQMIEDAIRVAQQMIDQAGPWSWTEMILADFQLIDYDLIKHGLEHAMGHQ